MKPELLFTLSAIEAPQPSPDEGAGLNKEHMLSKVNTRHFCVHLGSFLSWGEKTARTSIRIFNLYSSLKSISQPRETSLTYSLLSTGEIISVSVPPGYTWW